MHFFLFFFFSFILFLLFLLFFSFFASPFLSFPSLFNYFLLNLLSQNRNGIVLNSVVMSSLMRLFSRRVSMGSSNSLLFLNYSPSIRSHPILSFLIPYFTHFIPSCPIPIIPFRDLNSVWGFLPTTK